MLAAVVAMRLVLAAAPPAEVDEPRSAFEELRGFSTVVVSHLEAVLGTENLPAGMGVPIEPGVLVTVTPERIQVFDQNVVVLKSGRFAAADPAPDCRSGCPAAAYDGFLRAWLDLALEAKGLALEIPTRMLFGVHRSVPASTLLQVAYAAAESRPVQPPTMSLAVHGGRAGVRALPFMLLPPAGLELAPGSNVLGLTVSVGAGGRFVVTAASQRFGRRVPASGIAALVAVLRDIKKHHPGKDTIIIRPEDDATVDDVVATMAAAREDFPKVVLGGAQPVLAP